MDFWGTLSTLEVQIPFTQQKIERLFHTTLTDRPDASNDLYHFFEGGPVILKDGTSIPNISFDIKTDGTRPGDAGIKIGYPCIFLEEVKSHYKNIKFDALSGAGTIYAQMSYAIFKPWGKLSFSFKEQTPECLIGVGFQVSYVSDIIYTIEVNIQRTKQKIEQGKWRDQSNLTQGLNWAGLGNMYATPSVVANAKRQLDQADQLENSGQLEKAVSLRLEVLQMRLADFKARYPKPNPR